MARLRRVVSRLRVDGRLPDPMGKLVRELAMLSSRSAVSGLTARVLPPVGRLAPWARTQASLVPGRLRRWVIAGDATESTFDMAHTAADTVVDALQGHGLRPFLTRASDRNLQFGLPASDRPEAWKALQALLELGNGWYVEWRRGNRRGMRLVSRRRRAPRSALGAEWWRVFRLHRVANDAVAGHDEAAEITFWAPGEQGRLERLGLRGLHRFPADAAATTETVNGYTYPGVSSFPITAAMTRFTEPIDIVYTWVDGSDPEWRREFEKWRRADPPKDDVDDAHWGRYTSRDELRYSLRSVWLYAGWARRIYLVTAGQMPSWLEPDDRLVLVPHSDIFPEDWLPTFNSHAIESRLHHIEDLAEHFVYFNDDVFLGRPTERTQFFTPNGLLRFIEGEGWVVDEGSDSRNRAVDIAARNGRILIETTFGRVVERKLAHVPHALRRSVLFEIEDRFADRLKAISRHRFRHRDDLAVASGFAQHYAFCTSRAVPGELSYVYQNVESGRLPMVLKRLGLGRDIDTFCLNQTEVLEEDPERIDRLVTGFLESYYAVPSPWERDRGG